MRQALEPLWEPTFHPLSHGFRPGRSWPHDDRRGPQGGPLSPLLSTVVLDEFDQELARRGHSFVRQWPRDRVQPNFTSVLTDIAYLRSSEGIVHFTFIIDVISLIVAATSAAHADAHSSTRRHPSGEQEAG